MHLLTLRLDQVQHFHDCLFLAPLIHLKTLFSGYQLPIQKPTAAPLFLCKLLSTADLEEKLLGSAAVWIH